mgnify:CR=1 FL=1
MRRVILFLGLMVLLSYFVSADQTLNDTYENGTVQGWGGGIATSSNPLNGTHSFVNAKTDSSYTRAQGMATNSSFNVSFKIREDMTDGGCYRFGVGTQPHVLATSLHIAFGPANQCSGGGDATTVWVSDGSTTVSDSGKTLAEATTGKGNNLTFEINATKSGSVTDTVWRLFINNDAPTIWYDTAGNTPPRKLTNLFIKDTPVNNMWLDDIKVYNTTGMAFGVPAILPPINCTVCNVPFGDTVAPYTTSDTTPTFRFTTNLGSYCRIGDEDQNYTTMGAIRECGTTGSFTHVCSLNVIDELIASTDYVYLSCKNAGTNEESAASQSGALQMEITSLSGTIADAIDAGIQRSRIWPGATIYTNQQVYLRSLSNQQLLATVDKIAVSGNQRWIINNGLDGENALGLFNITPVVYVLDLVNVSSDEMSGRVSALINATKN